MTQPEKYYAVDAEDIHLKISSLKEELDNIDEFSNTAGVVILQQELEIYESIIRNYPLRFDMDWHK